MAGCGLMSAGPRFGSCGRVGGWVGRRIRGLAGLAEWAWFFGPDGLGLFWLDWAELSGKNTTFCCFFLFIFNFF